MERASAEVDTPDTRTSPARRGSALLSGVPPRQWVKNILVFVAPGAAGVLTHPNVILRSVGTFAVFCAAASATYLVNDVLDAQADRSHPVKCRRPVAAGDLSPARALGVAAALACSAFAGGWAIGSWQLEAVMAAYVALTLSYSLVLKRLTVIELTAVAAGFVLRAIAGGVSVHVPLSEWFLVVTSFGALFLVIGKRVGEQGMLGPARAEHRVTLAEYTPQFLRSALTLSATALVTSYCLWAFDRTGLSHHGHHLVWIELSVAPVITGVLYVLRLLDAGEGGSPTELALRDRTLEVLGVAWVLLVGIGIYS